MGGKREAQTGREEDERKKGKEERGGAKRRKGGWEGKEGVKQGGSGGWEARSKESYVALLKLSSNLYFTNLCFQDFERYNCTASLYCVRILNLVLIM